MLDDHDRQPGAPGDGILHREERDALVDQDELERQLVDHARLLARRDERPDRLDLRSSS